jgi:hypothetical protein
MMQPEQDWCGDDGPRSLDVPVSVLLGPTLNARSRQARVKPPKCDGRHILTAGDVKSSQLRRHWTALSSPRLPLGLSKYAEGR